MKNTLGRTVGSVFAAWAFGLLSLAVLSACGDDGSGTGKNTSENEESVAELETLDDLPACTASKSGTLASVAGDYYTCAAKKWEKVLEVSKGICNIKPCDKSTEGEWIYAYSAGAAYQCKSGVWKDADGKTFDELEFVVCFMDALVQDTLESAEDLKNCTEKKEGDVFAIGKNMVACHSKNWVDIPGVAVSEGDLPDCSGNGFIYVMGKMAVYQCKDGTWYGNGKAVNQTSADVPKSSSSQSGSGNKPSSSSKEVVDDGTKVRGVCQVSKSAVEKGETVAYSFYNMGGTIVSYTWNFDENASATTSDAATPEVSFSSGGTHRAKLVLNKGRASESDEIVCPGVTVEAVPVTGCTCTTDATGMVLREGRDVNATWTVSGCSGEAPFTYEWSNGASGTGTSALGSPETTGNYAPVVTVTNSDGGTMEPVCKTVPVMEPVKANCSMTPSYFMISSIAEISEDIPSVDMTLVSRMDEVSKDTAIAGYKLQRFNYDTYEYEYYYSYSIAPTSIELTNVSAYALYAVVYAGDTICTATLANCGPSERSVDKGETVSWSLGSAISTISTPTSYLWTFTDGDGNETTSAEVSPQMTASTSGKITATLIIDKGKSSENSLVCSSTFVMDFAEPLIDIRDNQSYKTVNIGSQTWMAENLNYEADGSVCPLEDDSHCDTYGRLYDAPENDDFCPEGWHIPTPDDWENLIEYVDNYNGMEGVGKSLKASDGWMTPGTLVDGYYTTRIAVASGENYFGFSALPAGCCWNDECYSDDETRFWVSDGGAYKIPFDDDWIRLDEDVEYASSVKFSVRCVKD